MVYLERKEEMKDYIKYSVSITTKSGSISSLGNVFMRDFDGWAIEFFDETESIIIAKTEVNTIVLRPSTEDGGKKYETERSS